MNIKDKQRDIYYEYLSIKSFEEKYHLVNIDSENYSFLIPESYQIKYSRSTTNYNGIGHIQFYNDKSKFTLDYIKEDYQTFKFYLNTQKNKITKTFTNYRNQDMYELLKDNIDYIYMYFNGYMYKLTSDHKLSINEYFDMYFILFSITDTIIHENLNLLRDLNVLQNQGINLFCNDEDILVMDLSNMSSLNSISRDDIIISSDEEYQNYIEKKRKVKLIGYNVLTDRIDKELNVVNVHDSWKIEGTFFFGCLGYYNEGYISDYQEITDSKELREEEKINLLNTMIRQKQMETDSYEDIIRDTFYKYLVNVLLDNLSYDLWDKTHLRDFINLNILTSDYENNNDFDLYNLFNNFLHSNSSVKKIFKQKKIYDSINGEKLIIYPDHYELTLSGCNYILDSVTLIIDEEYLIKY